MKKAKRITKKDIYAKFGILFSDGKVYAPVFGWIAPLLIDGNEKLGKGVWTFSTLPGKGWFTVDFGTPESPDVMEVQGTCPCTCPGCYAMTGFYNMPSTLRANALKTVLSRLYLEFVERAIMAQIEADKIKLLRVHASGDFFSAEYIAMWRRIAQACKRTVFWTYTKNPDALHVFDGLENANIVKSVIPGLGFNFGDCAHLLRVYYALRAAGNTVYICRCGIDKNQHCNACRGCATHDFVLFLEHSTSYKAELDPLFPQVKALIESQPAPEPFAI